MDVITVHDMRKVTGLSQSKFADLLEIPVANIQRWEQEIVSPPAYVARLIQRDLQHRGYEV